MKKIMLSSVILLPLVILLVLTIGSVVVGMTNHIYVETVSFREVDTLVLVKDSLDSVPSAKPEVNVFPLAATNAQLVYTSDDETVAKVGEDGTVYGVDFGQTRIRAVSKENPAIGAERVVLVTDSKAHRVEIEGAPSELYEGERIQLRASVYPKEAEDKTVRWSSSDPSVLDVSSDGTLTFRSVGTAAVTASVASDPSVSASVQIRCKRPVTDIDTGGVTSVTTAASSAQFPAVRFTPADAAEEIVYSVSDKTVADVSDTGEITFKAPGKTDVTAAVTDGLGNTASATVHYEYTGGMYQSIWFERNGERVDSFEVDYDEYFNIRDLGLAVCGTPLDASAQVEVAWSGEDKIECRGGKYYVIGTGETVLTASARTYTGQTLQATCTVRISRNVSSVSFPGAEGGVLSVTKDTVDIYSIMQVSPSGENDGYTEALRFRSSDPAVASVGEDGRIRFLQEGSVYITAESESGVSAKIKITYIYVPLGEKAIEISDSTVSGELAGLSLNSTEGQKGTLVVAPPAGYDGAVRFEIVSGDSVALEGNGIAAVKGGFTRLRVSAEGSSSGADVWSREIVVYVDEDIRDMSFNVQEGYRLSGAELPLSVSVTRASALEGKTVRYRLKTASSAASVDPETGLLRFSGAGQASVVAEVFYDAEKLSGADYDFSEVLGSREISVTCLYGNLDSFVLGCRSNEVAENDLFEMKVGEKLVFSIDKDKFSPADFVLTEDKISVYADTAALAFEVDAEAGTITAVAEEGTFAENGAAGPAEVRITVGGKTLRIRIAVHAYADRISVQAGMPSQEGSVRDVLSSGEYVTLSENLSFRISLRRADGLALTDRTLQWFCGSQSGTLDLGASDALVLTGLPLGEQTQIRFEAAGGLDFLFTLERRAALEDYGVSFRYSKNVSDGGQFTAAEIQSVLQAQSLSQVKIALPDGINSFFAYILLPDNYLGGLTAEEFGAAFRLENLPAGTISALYDGDIAMIEFGISAAGAVNKNFQLWHGDLLLDLQILRSDLKSIGFGSETVSFDMGDPSMDGAVYRGLQQARLFAKHSYYGGKTVDYFKLPLAVTGSIEAVQWTFTPYAGDTAGEARTVQIGNTIYSGGKEYTLGQAELTQNGVSWVDIAPYAAEGCVYVYFGNFDGLSEEDLRTDNFGNFDGSEGYVPADANDPGTFLQLTASDGTGNGAEDYYNFNVLNDVQGKVVNIFDAEGFYNNSAFVLHTSLYSSTDKPVNDPDTLILSDGSVSFSKSFIYGNGYKINYKARSENSDIWAGGSEQKADIGVGRAYNVTLSGTDALPAQQRSGKMHAVFTGTWFRYCTVQACYKGVYTGAGKDNQSPVFYIENCVFRYMDDMAVQLAGSYTPKTYMKNLVLVDCNKGLENQVEAFYVGGFIDTFNYKAEENLDALGVIGFDPKDILDEAAPYVETLGGKPFFNLAVVFSKSGAVDRPLKAWDGTAVGDEWKISDQMSLKRVFAKKLLLGFVPISIWTYVYADNMPADAYRISLQCQGTAWNSEKKCLVENAEHLAWHMNRCYRSPALAKWYIENHAEHLAQSLA